MILMTGATDGLGRRVTAELVKAGKQVIAHGRDFERLRRLRDELGVETLQADLADLRQVDRLANEVLDHYGRLDVLVNNAGIGAGGVPARRETSTNGIELRFAVNYLAGYHLTRRLTPLLGASAPSRIVNVASIGQQRIDFDDPQLAKSYDGARAYRQSKLAQIMFTFDLADEVRDRGITVNSLHPASLMPTTMVRETGAGFLSTLDEGASALLPLITGHELDGVTGCYFEGTAHLPTRAHAQAYDLTARQRLRQLSTELVTAALDRNA